MARFGKSTHLYTHAQLGRLGGGSTFYVDPKGAESFEELLDDIPQDRLDELVWVDVDGEDEEYDRG